MPWYRNTDTDTRRWDTLSHPDGGTLQLAPNEEVELNDTIRDPFLKPVRKKSEKMDDLQPKPKLGAGRNRMAGVKTRAGNSPSGKHKPASKPEE